MKTTKIIIISALSLLLLGGIGAFIHFKNKFMSAPPNLLVLSETGTPFDFIWHGQSLGGVYEPHAAMFVPVRIPGIDQLFHMQFDTGAPSTVFYWNAVKSINEKYGDVFQVKNVDDTWLVEDVRLTVGSVNLEADHLAFRGMGREIDWSNLPPIINIGTVGSDFMERYVLKIDYPNEEITLSDSVPNGSIPEEEFMPFTFDGRKVFLSTEFDGERASLWFDSGSSPNELIVEESTFEKLAVPGAQRETSVTNSWGTDVTRHKIEAEGEFMFGTTSVPLTNVTYIEWPNKLQVLIMKLSNIGGDLGGMTGNKLFLDKTLVLDTPNLRYAVIP